MGNENGKLVPLPKLPSKCDLMTSAQNHYSLVQELVFHPHLFSPPVVKYAMLRYEKYWLPFAAKNPGVKLVAPLDIELIWVAHILDIKAYKRDCSKIARQVIYHYIPSMKERHNNTETQTLWKQMFKDTPLNTDHSVFATGIPSYDSFITTDLTIGVQKYRHFCQQVLLPHYSDTNFIYAAIFRYLSELIYGESKSKLVTYDKIFIQHTHILNPTAYLSDMSQLTASFARSVQSKIDTSSAKEKHLLKEKAGSLFRCEVTPLTTLTDVKKLKSLTSRHITFHVMGYEIVNLIAGKQYRLKIRGTSYDGKDESTLLTFRVGKESVSETFPERSADTTLQYDSAVFDVLRIRVSELKLRDSSIKKRAPLGEYHFDFDIFNSFFNTDTDMLGKEFKLEFSLPHAEGKTNEEGEEEAKSWVRFRCDDFKVGFVNLNLRIQSRSKATKSDHFHKVLAYPLLMAPHLKATEAPCLHKIKSIKDRYGETLYRCRVLRLVSGLFCSTEVFDLNQRIICCSYTVGNESLPTERQVADPTTCCILRKDVDTVFVIRSTNYDWGLLKVFNTTTEGGTLKPSLIIFMNLKDLERRWETLYDATKKINTVYYKVKKNGLIVDIFAGKLSIPPLQYEYPELLSLGVTILSLFHSFPAEDL